MTIKYSVILVVIIALAAIGIAACADKDSDVSYYTCPMHPQIRMDAPGSCPICGMDLVPVKKKAAESKNGSPHHDHSDHDHPASDSSSQGISIDPNYVQRIGVTTVPVERRSLSKLIKSYGKIAHDPDWWIAENEYLEALTLGDAELIAATELKLRFLGLPPEWIDELRAKKKASASLHLPSGGTRYVEAFLYQGDANEVKRGERVEILDDNGRLLERGKIVAVGTMIDMESRNLRILIRADKEFLQKPNTFVQVEIEIPIGEAVSIPKAALLMNGDHNMVYVLSPDGTYLPKTVEIGALAGNFYAVKSGLSEGEQVVTNGQFLIDSETQIRLGGTSGGHTH